MDIQDMSKKEIEEFTGLTKSKQDEKRLKKNIWIDGTGKLPKDAFKNLKNIQ